MVCEFSAAYSTTCKSRSFLLLFLASPFVSPVSRFGHFLPKILSAFLAILAYYFHSCSLYVERSPPLPQKEICSGDRVIVMTCISQCCSLLLLQCCLRGTRVCVCVSTRPRHVVSYLYNPSQRAQRVASSVWQASVYGPMRRQSFVRWFGRRTRICALMFYAESVVVPAVTS